MHQNPFPPPFGPQRVNGTDVSRNNRSKSVQCPARIVAPTFQRLLLRTYLLFILPCCFPMVLFGATPQVAVLTSPAPGTTLNSSTNVTFGWTTGTGVTMYQLWIGTTGPGSSDLYQSGWTTGTSVVVPSLPSDGVTIYARLYSSIEGVWQPADFTYTEPGTPVPSSLTSPTPGSTLTSSTNVQFHWSTGAGVAYYMLWIGTTGPGSQDLYSSSWVTTTSATVPSIPANALPIYVRLFSQINGVWQSQDYTYTESGTPTPACLISPTPSSKISGSGNVTFGWTTGVGVSMYQLWIGTTGPGSNDLYQSGWTTSTSVAVPSPPSNGVTVYARLYSRIDGVWQPQDYTYSESGTPSPATLTSPTPGSTLTSSTNVQFRWTTGAGVTLYQLWLGTTGPSSSNLYESGWTANTSVVIPSLPSNGVTIYARLYSRINGLWQSADFTYTELGTPTSALMTSPSPGTTLTSSTNVPFHWTTGAGVAYYMLWVGTTGPGSQNLYDSSWVTTTSVSVPNIPGNGLPVYVRLLSMINGVWQSSDYTYTAAPPVPTALSCTNSSFSGSGTDLCVVVLNAAAQNVLFLSLSSNNAAVSVPALLLVPANAIKVVFTATVSSVGSTRTVTLTASKGSASTTFALQLNPAVPTLSVNATSVAFGSVEQNTASTQSVTLASTGTAPVTIASAAATGTGFTLGAAALPVTLTPGQTSTLDVQFDPASAGAATGNLTITSNSSNGATTVISLTGQGTAPVVDLSWNAPSSSPDPVAGYNVYRAPVGTTSYELLNSTDDTQTTYIDSTVQSGQTYDYIVESVDASGVESGPSNMISLAVP